jgi:hypothetical protein
MINIDVCNNLEKAKGLWQRYWPRDGLFDLWPVRACFQSQYHHKPHFLVASRDGKFCGMIALSWIEGENCFGHFPGEVWQGKTWLEQNKIVAADQETARALLAHIPAGASIRYLSVNDRIDLDSRATEDETGYLFFPQQYQYSFEAYWNSFSQKSRKKIRCEMERLKAGGVSYRYDHMPDIDWMFRLNLERYQDKSYFSDPRFLRAFESLAAWLQANNLLRVTTVLVGGQVAAVDMGAVWNRTYTLLSGGTHAGFPGVAKLINLHHLEWACAQEMTMVDFLCGEFNWKHRFHLTPCRLFQIWQPQNVEFQEEENAWKQRAVCAV